MAKSDTVEPSFRKKTLLSIGLRLIRLTLVVLPFVCLCRYMVQYSVDFPYGDQWAVGHMLHKDYEGTLSFHDYWKPHNEHRLVLPKAVFLLLARWSGWNTACGQYGSVLVAVATFVALVCLARKTGKAMGGLGIAWLMPVISLLVFSLSQGNNWLMGWQLQIFMNVFATVLGIVLLTSAVFHWWKFVGSLVLGLAATFSFANGLLYWPIGVMILLLGSPKGRRTKRICLAVWLIVSLVVISSYLYDNQPVGAQGTRGDGFLRPYWYVRYVVAYLGSPVVNFITATSRVHSISAFAFTHFSFAGATIAGILGPILLCLLVGVLIRRKYANLQTLLPYIALSLYSILSAALTGVGRARMGLIQAMSPRYITIAYLLWFSIVVLLFLFVRRSWRERRREERRVGLGLLAAPATLLVLIGLLVCTAVSGETWMHRCHRVDLLRSRAEFLAVIRDDPVVEEIYRRENIAKDMETRLYDPAKGRLGFPNAHLTDEDVRRHLQFLKSHRLSIYRHLPPRNEDPPSTTGRDP